jgi:uncharacterized protein YaiE (UPF0345 family)
LIGGETPGSPIGGKEPIPAAFEAVGSEGVAGREVAGAFIKRAVTAAGGVAGDDELGADEEAIGVGPGCAEDLLVEVVEREFVAFGVFAPRNKKASAARVVGVGKEAKPVKVRDGERAFGEGTENLVKVRGVVKGVALDEDRYVGEVVVFLGEMVEVGVGFAADIGEGGSLGVITELIINGDSDGAWNTAKPCEVFAVPGNDEFKLWLHGGRQ